MGYKERRYTALAAHLVSSPITQQRIGQVRTVFVHGWLGQRATTLLACISSARTWPTMPLTLRPQAGSEVAEAAGFAGIAA